MTAPRDPAGPGRARVRDTSLGPRFIWVALAVLALVIIFSIAWVMLNEAPAGQETDTTLDDITANPTAYIGETVTVSGEVHEVISPRAVRMGGGLTQDPLLVVAVEEEPLAAPLLENDVIRVTGPVRSFFVAEMETQVDGTLDRDRLGEFEGQPAIVAEELLLLQS